MKDAVRQVTKVMLDCKIAIDPEQRVDELSPMLTEALYAWTNGMKFIDVMKLTDDFEGTVIRTIRRLDEVLRQLANASHAMGDMTLKAKFDECSNKIRRDIVFAASLYL